MDEVSSLLRQAFQTSNELTLAISGTGTSGMEAALVNLLEPGDSVVVGVNGLFGGRLADIATRCGANVTTVSAEWGQALDPAAVERPWPAQGRSSCWPSFTSRPPRAWCSPCRPWRR